MFILNSYSEHHTNIFIIFVSHHSSKKAKKREAKRRKQAAKVSRAKSLPASREALNNLETSTLRSLNMTDQTASTLFSGSIESIPSTIHESQIFNGSTDSLFQFNSAVVSYHNWN